MKEINDSSAVVGNIGVISVSDVKISLLFVNFDKMLTRQSHGVLLEMLSHLKIYSQFDECQLIGDVADQQVSWHYAFKSRGCLVSVTMTAPY